MSHLIRPASFISVVAGCALSAAAQPVVVPNAYTSVEGPTNNNYPFTIGAALPSQRYQQVFAASEFSAISGPHRITALRIRPDAQFAFSPWSANVTLDLRFSTTQVVPDQLSTTCANNTGPDETVVYSGSATYGTNQSSGGSVPGPWAFDIEIVFQTPFIYNPATGNLLMDVRKDGAAPPAPRPGDAVNAFGDGVSRLYTGSSTATTGNVDSVGIIVQFITEPAGNPCYANCDGSTTPPVLNVQDFSCFLGKFAAGDAYANCDGSTTPPVLNVQDFSCFLGKFAAGCP